MAQQPEQLETLELPKTTLAGFAKHFGPGMILMMTGIGTSHLVTAPVAGGRFEYALLWCIPIAYVFKYYGFEMAFRFTHATGRSMLDAYATAWRKWPLWYVLITTLLQCAIGQAARLVAASAVVFYFFSEYLGLSVPIPHLLQDYVELEDSFSSVSQGAEAIEVDGGISQEDFEITVYGLLLGITAVAIILVGKYAVFELLTKVCAGMLFVSTVAVYLVEPAPFSAMGHFFLFETPQESWLIIAAFLGLLPTGIDVSLQASEWGKAKNVGMAKIRDQLEQTGAAARFDPFVSKKADLTVNTSALPAQTLEYCRRWFAIGLWDFRLGHVVSFVIACVFLLLAAVWIYPSPVAGNQVMGEIAGMFTRSVGPWMMIVFLTGAFAATFSTAFNYFDGWPRVVGACCRNLFRSTARLRGIAQTDLTQEHKRRWHSEYNIYRLTMFYSLVASVTIIAGVGRPVFLVLVASALAFFIAPVVFFLNLYYCFSVIPKGDKIFYPSTFASWFSWMSLVVFTGLSAILIMARLFGIALFGE